MLYLYYKDMVTGISFDILSLLNVRMKNVLFKIKRNENNIIFTNDKNIDDKIKRLIVNKQYVIPYLLSLK